MWGHVIGDTVRFDRLDPPLMTFTGRTKYTLSAFGEHVISEEVEGAIADASRETRSQVKDWHVGPVFHEPLGHHEFVVEFLNPPLDPDAFRDALDLALSRRNAHYQWFRADGGGLPAPTLVIAPPGAFDDWMRTRGKLGGQNKVPRMDSTGKLTAQLLSFLNR
jgi:GH3 auxin-responsive promoter